MRRENVPLGYFAVPLNIICSSIWDKPARPITSLREPTLYHTWTVATGALGTSTNRTFIPLERMNSRGSVATAGDAKNTQARQLAAIKQPMYLVMCREYSQVIFGRYAQLMLATGFDLCQDRFGILR